MIDSLRTDDRIMTVTGCKRCSGNHKDLQFRRFLGNPVGRYLYWGTCPVLEEPILMKLQTIVVKIG